MTASDARAVAKHARTSRTCSLAVFCCKQRQCTHSTARRRGMSWSVIAGAVNAISRAASRKDFRYGHCICSTEIYCFGSMHSLHAPTCTRQAVSTILTDPKLLARRKLLHTARKLPDQRCSHRRCAFQDQPAQLDMEDPKVHPQSCARVQTRLAHADK